MSIGCIFKTPREACVVITKIFQASKSENKLFALPFNRFDPEKSIWWLSPSSANPAYKYGKFGFIPYENNEILVGLYVEKGLGADYCSIAGSKAANRMVMDKDWLWHDFIRELGSDQLLSILNEIGSNTLNNPEIHIWGGYQHRVLNRNNQNIIGINLNLLGTLNYMSLSS